MIALAARLVDLSPALTSSLLAAVWQGVLLAAIAGLALRLLPKTPAAVRFAIWFGVFLTVTALPAISLLPGAQRVTQSGGRSTWLTFDQRWSLAIAAVWLVASLVRAGTLVAAGLRVRALWKRATPVEVSMASQPAGSRRAQICVSDEVDRPTVIGFFSPKILIPGRLLAKLSPAELEQIVLHEAGHLGRADDWMNLLQKIALVAFPLNPALAWVEHRLCFERELAVDERVLHAFAGKPGAAKAYAECLTTLAEYRLGRRGLALALGALGRESELGRRIGRILRRGERMRPLHAKLVLGGAMLGLLAAAAGFEHCPQVVGFSSAKAQTVARTGADQVTDSHFVALSGAHVLVSNVLPKTRNTNRIQPVPHVPHETLAVALQPSAQPQRSLEGVVRGNEAVNREGSNSAHVIQTMAPVSASHNRPRSISDVEPSQPAGVVMQWVVVSTWQGGEETRTVLTTATAPDANGPAEPAGAQPRPSDEAHPYAAVPVQGGWLVFQL
jgi:beta-lactamase regulating signal transducer with metallopeptidase domain